MFAGCGKDAMVRGRGSGGFVCPSWPDWLRTWSFRITRGGDAG